ncbi:MAG TPA: hypothetical protein VD866_14990 [Urbifossiella sp.]|nr:hypothetical protein [Urbifossiella sp.]
MQLWTHHSGSFRPDRLDLRVEPEKGFNWLYQAPGFRYREVAPKLWDLVGTNQLLWCCTLRGVFSRGEEDVGLVEWEIAAPPARVLAFIRTGVWDDLVMSRGDRWDELFVRDAPRQGDPGIRALVAVPLPAGCAVCHGPLAARDGR